MADFIRNLVRDRELVRWKNPDFWIWLVTNYAPVFAAFALIYGAKSRALQYLAFVFLLAVTVVSYLGLTIDVKPSR